MMPTLLVVHHTPSPAMQEMLEAALAGAGLAYIGEPSVAEHIAAGRLEVVLADWTPPYPGLSLYFAGRRHIPARLRALIDLIREPTLLRSAEQAGDARGPR